MKNLNSKRFALATFVVFALCFCGIAVTNGHKVSDLWTALVIAYKTIPLVLFILGFFVSYAWKWKIFQGWLVPFPNLNGTWQGKIQTTWINPETGKTPGPIPAILTIKQSFINISCVMRTAEMTSRSFLADFCLNGDDQVRALCYSYQSKPLATVVKRSPPHDGTIHLELLGKPVNKLKGNYWTGRKTTGEVEFSFRESKRLDEFPKDLGKHPVSKK